MGGAIRAPRVKDVPVDTKRIEFTERLEPETRVEEDTDDETDDEELNTFTHMGGRLSGKGAAHDPPDVVMSVSKSLQAFPELQATYLSGRVPRPRKFEDEFGHAEPMHAMPRQDAGASVIDFGGSLPAVTHSVDGYLVAHNHHFPHEFHLY